MNSNDLLITGKVFHGPYKQLITVLSTQQLPVYKAENFIAKQLSKAVHDIETLPVDVEDFVKSLQLDIMFPDARNEKLVCKPVFFSLSRHIQHNILSFLKAIQYSDDFPESSNTLKTFLEHNSTYLDQWGKILDRAMFPSYEKCSVVSLGHSSIRKLKSLRSDRFPVAAPFVKKRRLHESIIEVESDGEDFMSICEEVNWSKRTTCISSQLYEEKKYTIKREISEIMSQGDQVDREINIKYQNDEESIESTNLTLSGSKSTISILKEYLQSPDVSKFSNLLLDILLSCPRKEVEIICEKINLKTIPEEKLQSIFSFILKQDTLPLECLRHLFHHSVTSRLVEIREPISRTLFSILSDVLKKYKRLVICNILCETIQSSNFSKIQEDIFKKLLTTGDLQLDDASQVLENIFRCSTDGISITSCHLSLIDCLLHSKPMISTNCLAKLLSSLYTYSTSNHKCLKLMKLLITIVQNYPTSLSGQRKLLERIADGNTTFLKNKFVLLLQNINQ